MLANLSRIKRREHRTHLGYGWEGCGQWAIQKEHMKADFRENTEGIRILRKSGISQPIIGWDIDPSCWVNMAYKSKKKTKEEWALCVQDVP